MVILGGWNDKYTSEEILNGVKRTVNKCRSLYPNARIHIGMAAFDTDVSRFDKAAILKAYEKAAAENGCYYVWGIEDALKKEYMASDGIHPNADGQLAIAKELAAYLSDSVLLPAATQLYGTVGAGMAGYAEQSGTWMKQDGIRRRIMHLPEKYRITAGGSEHREVKGSALCMIWEMYAESVTGQKVLAMVSAR